MIVEINTRLKVNKYPYLAKYTQKDTGYYYIAVFTHRDENTVYGSVLLNPWDLVDNSAHSFEESCFERFEGTLTISNE